MRFSQRLLTGVLLVISSFITAGSFAQNSTGDLAVRTFNRIEKDGASTVKGRATLNYGNSSDIKDFVLSLSGDKFHIVLDEGETIAWFDSKTLWNAADYGNGIEEIYISTPSDDDVAVLNPARLLRSTDRFRITEKGNDTFVMEPLGKGETVFGLSKVTVKVNAVTLRPVRIDLVMGVESGGSAWDSGSTVSLNINSWLPGQKFQDSMFTCPVSNYPNAEIIDLR